MNFLFLQDPPHMDLLRALSTIMASIPYITSSNKELTSEYKIEGNGLLGYTGLFLFPVTQKQLTS